MRRRFGLCLVEDFWQGSFREEDGSDGEAVGSSETAAIEAAETAASAAWVAGDGTPDPDPAAVVEPPAPEPDPAAVATPEAPAAGEWDAGIAELVARGVTPAQLQEFLAQEQQGEPETPAPVATEDVYADWLAEQGLDPADFSAVDAVSMASAFRMEQALASLQAQANAASEQALAATWNSDLQAVTAQFPEFANPVLRNALLNVFEGGNGVEPNRAELVRHATELKAAFTLQTAAAVAQYAVDKAADAVVPPVGGGGTPAPTAPKKDFHSMSAAEQDAQLEGYLDAAGGS